MHQLCQQKSTSQKKKSTKQTVKRLLVTTNEIKKKLKRKEWQGIGNKPIADLTGRRFGRLVATKFLYREAHNSYWQCLCDCGKLSKVTALHLNSGHTKSCGCLSREHKDSIGIRTRRLDLEGRKFGRLLVLGFVGTRYEKALWKCKCECGKIVNILGNHLLRKNTRSCGCIAKELAKRKGSKNPHWRHDLSLRERELSKRRTLLPRTKSWRKRVFKRDNYTCQLSGQRSGGLCAHHISAWNKSPSLRYRTSNGITLSERIHKLFHRVYGAGGNTKKQFQEFSHRYASGEFVLTFSKI